MVLTCDQALDRFSTYLSKSLSGVPLLEFQEHIRGCAVCHDKLMALDSHLHMNRPGRDQSGSA